MKVTPIPTTNDDVVNPPPRPSSSSSSTPFSELVKLDYTTLLKLRDEHLNPENYNVKYGASTSHDDPSETFFKRLREMDSHTAVASLKKEITTLTPSFLQAPTAATRRASLRASKRRKNSLANGDVSQGENAFETLLR
jgi:hypothetical protein